jgi:hypothetical protein
MPVRLNQGALALVFMITREGCVPARLRRAAGRARHSKSDTAHYQAPPV